MVRRLEAFCPRRMWYNKDMSGIFDDIDLSAGVDDLEEEIAFADPAPEADVQINEALKRIEQAQLYKTLLGHSLFAEGSARPEVQSIVEQEIRTFVITRLEILVGVRSEQVAAVAAPSQFSEDEVSALRLLATRVLSKATAPAPAAPNPQLNQVHRTAEPEIVTPRVSRPVVNQVAAPKTATKPAPKAAPKPATPQASAPAAPAGKRRKGSNNISEITGKDHSQAVSTKSKPIRMPGPNKMNQIEASRTNESLGSMDADPTGQGQLLKAIAQIAIKNNANISEE